MTTASPVIAIVGPTGVGKTALALAVARRFNAEIIGCDASQVYIGLDLGTGKVRPDEAAGVPHHLIDVVAPDAPFDAGAYARLGDAALAGIRARGGRALICGGTGLYLRALVEGLCEAPAVDPAIRSELQARLAAGEGTTLHAELAQVDPAAAARIFPADHPRLERALGVFRTTGRSLSEWQALGRASAPRHDVRYLGLTAPRELLRRRIAERSKVMFERGLLDEVRALEAAGYTRDLKSMQAIGYRQAAACLHGEISRDEALRLTIDATRQYAKRQETWFRALPNVAWHASPADLAAVESWVDGLWGAP
jgi:tRNA dimethylallyltransferase